jgi:hypothetical protein
VQAAELVDSLLDDPLGVLVLRDIPADGDRVAAVGLDLCDELVSALQIARPIPREPPVTSAILS